MSENLDLMIANIVTFVGIVGELHAAQHGPAHTVLADQNLDREWIENALRADWESYVAQTALDFPQKSLADIRREVFLVQDALESLLRYPDEVLEMAEEQFR